MVARKISGKRVINVNQDIEEIELRNVDGKLTPNLVLNLVQFSL